MSAHATYDHDYMLRCARGAIRNDDAYEVVRSARYLSGINRSWPEMAAALAEGDAAYPDDPRWDTEPPPWADDVDADPATVAAFEGLAEERRTAKEAKQVQEGRTPSSPSSPSSLNSPFAMQERPWPTLDPDMLYGLAGDAVRLIEEFTEADPVVIYATLLAELGCMIGPGPHVRAGHVDHPARLNVIAVGKTAKARKGTSAAAAGIFTKKVDPEFMATRVLGGFGSGEALVDEVRDPVPSNDPDVPDDPGSADARLLVKEGEFATVLSVCTRESSTLSQHIRNAWDGVRLETRSRTKKSVSTRHHICVVGHITAEELRKGLNAVESLNGFANRMLFVCAKRARLLPFDDEPDPVAVEQVAAALATRVEKARHIGRVQFAQDARPVWERLYKEMDQDCAGGMLGAITARSEPYTLRIALLLALLDGSRLIEVDHLNAAYALWNYCRESAAYIWGDAIGDENADKLLAALRKAGPEGLDGSAQSAVFSRKLNAKKLAAARAELERRGLVQTWEVPTDGRPRIVSRAVAKSELSEPGERGEPASQGTPA